MICIESETAKALHITELIYIFASLKTKKSHIPRLNLANAKVCLL